VTISIIIPAYNESNRISSVIKSAAQYAHEIIVVDDGSTDNTADLARESGAQVINQEHNGYIAAIKKGFQAAKYDIIVTMDADGEHNPEDIPHLTTPVLSGEADLVFGVRLSSPRLSECLINWLASFRLKLSDTCTGFRAITRDLALQLHLNGVCTCGTFALEAVCLSARIKEVPIATAPTDKPRRIAWYHLKQVYYVLYWMIKSNIKKEHAR
jgi:glycosyltransferase involved in cell wall biosynthesis